MHHPQSSLAHRLRTTPHLIAECEGCTVVEPLAFHRLGHNGRGIYVHTNATIPEGRTQDSAGAGVHPLSVRPGADVSLSHGQDR